MAMAIFEKKGKSNHADKTAAPTTDNTYSERRSHVDPRCSPVDHETWTEALTVTCASATAPLALRPCFRSRKTGRRVWDKPPSGASHVVYATPAARDAAQARLERMEFRRQIPSVVRDGPTEWASNERKNSYARALQKALNWTAPPRAQEHGDRVHIVVSEVPGAGGGDAELRGWDRGGIELVLA